MNGLRFRLRIDGQEIKASSFSLEGPEVQTVSWSISEKDFLPALGSPGALIEIGSFYSELARFFGREEVAVEFSAADGSKSRVWPRCRIDRYAFELPGGSSPAELFLQVLL